MLCGQGADELFGGYNRYLECIKKYENIIKETNIQIKKNLKRIKETEEIEIEEKEVDQKMPNLVPIKN